MHDGDSLSAKTIAASSPVMLEPFLHLQQMRADRRWRVLSRWMLVGEDWAQLCLHVFENFAL
jgi:hypothetical protein